MAATTGPDAISAAAATTISRFILSSFVAQHSLSVVNDSNRQSHRRNYSNVYGCRRLDSWARQNICVEPIQKEDSRVKLAGGAPIIIIPCRSIASSAALALTRPTHFAKARQ
jgi:hypothetical protein